VGRPRKASDEDILKGAFRALTRLGPGRLTLLDVAREAGVSAAALVHRFGSKRALLLAAARDAGSGADYIFADLRARHRSPLAALLGLGECVTFLGDTPEAVAHNLAFLQLDLDDFEFHRHALAGSKGFRRGLRNLVKDAIRARELMPCDASRLASALQAVLNGSLRAWVVHRQGALAPWLRRDLQTLLERYRPSPPLTRPRLRPGGHGASRRRSGPARRATGRRKSRRSTPPPRA
jgi:AcrR family transcriptional regulator